MNRRFMNEFAGLFVFELAFALLIFIALTVLRYFNAELLTEIMGIFDEYVNTEVTLSLVLDGR